MQAGASGAVDVARRSGEKGFAMAFYAAASISMMLVNKAAVKALPFPIFLCVVQNAATLVFAYIVGSAFPGHAKLGFKVKLTREVIVTWTPALLLFITMLISSLSAMEYISVPSVLVFRALTPLVTAVCGMHVLGDRPSTNEWLSLVLIVVGALCYLATDPSFSLPGYLWMMINLVTAAAYHVYVRRAAKLARSPLLALLVLALGLSPCPHILGRRSISLGHTHSSPGRRRNLACPVSPFARSSLLSTPCSPPPWTS